MSASTERVHSGHLSGQCPQSACVGGIGSPRFHSADAHVISLRDVRDVAVLEVRAGVIGEYRCRRCPHRCSGALGGSLEPRHGVAIRRRPSEIVFLRCREVTLKGSEDAPGMDGERTDTA